MWSPTPWRDGHLPVIIDATEGSDQIPCAVQVVPIASGSADIRLRFGIVFRGCPPNGVLSPRILSNITQIMFFETILKIAYRAVVGPVINQLLIRVPSGKRTAHP